MNDQLQTALADIIGKTTNAISTGVSFLQAELPDVIHQLLMWKAVQSGVFFAALLLLFALGVWSASKVFRHGQKEGYGAEAFAMFPGAFAAGCLIAVFHNLAWLQIIIAPKVYLIEYAASLAK